jgi:hypothetical protein
MPVMDAVHKAWDGSGTQQVSERQGAVDSRRLQQLAPVVTVSGKSTRAWSVLLDCWKLQQ